MKVENIKILKKIFTSPIFWLCTILVVLFPAIIHLLFKFPGNNITVAVWTVESILEYGSTIIGSLIVYFTVVLTLYKNQEENEKIIEATKINNDKIIEATNFNNEKLLKTTIEENKKILNNSHNEKKYEDYSKSCDRLLSLISELKEIDISNVGKEFNDENSIKTIFKKLELKYSDLNAIVNQIQLHIPSYMREYFKMNFIDSTFFQFNNYIKPLINLYHFHSYNFNYPNDREGRLYLRCSEYMDYLDRFTTSVFAHIFAFSDCFFDEDKFVKKEVTDFTTSPWGITDIVSKYEKIYKYN